MTKTIGFIGLGAMGQRMAGRLLDAGHELQVFNRSPGPAEGLAVRGARVAETPRAAAQGADIVFTMVRDDDAAREVWLHPERGALGGMHRDAVAVESSTVTPSWIAELDRARGPDGPGLLDGPVAGSRPQAEAGALIFLVGGAAEALERVRPVLGAMGSAVHHCGSTGAGAALKLAVNALLGVQTAALAELLGLLDRAGIDESRALEILGEVPVTSRAAKGIAGLMVARQYAPMFPVDLAEKDMGYVVQAAGGTERAPTAEAVRSVFARASAAGLGAENLSAVRKLFG